MSTSSLVLVEGHTVVLDDKEQNIMAVRQRGVIEIWNHAGTFQYGELGEEAKAGSVRAVVHFFKMGFEVSREQGRQDMKRSILDLLGAA